jgi:hypothetical protein
MNKTLYFFEKLSFSMAYICIIWVFFAILGMLVNEQLFFYFYGLIVGLLFSIGYIIYTIMHLDAGEGY